MNHNHNIRSFLAGVFSALLVVSLMVPAFAVLSGKEVTIYPGVNVYMDEVPLNPTDANGNPVEVFIYNGTTYLPVRAVSEALNQVVQWEGESSSVYIGKHTGTKPAVWLSDLDYFDISGTWQRNDILMDNLGVEHEHTFRGNRTGNMLYYWGIEDGAYRIYKLNAQYTRLTGTLFQRYEFRATDGTTTIQFYGDGELLWSGTVSRGVDPMEFNVDITGVLELRIQVKASENSCGALGEVGLWT